MERPRIFISYCREDRPFVDRLLNKLAKLPVQPWQLSPARGRSSVLAMADGVRE